MIQITECAVRFKKPLVSQPRIKPCNQGMGDGEDSEEERDEFEEQNSQLDEIIGKFMDDCSQAENETSSIYELTSNGNAARPPKVSTSKSKKKKKKPLPVLTIDRENTYGSVKNGLDRASKAEVDALQNLKELYESALKFRDLYFDNFPIEKAKQRASDVSDFVAKSLRIVTDLGKVFKPRNLSWYFAYRALVMSVDSTKLADAHKELLFAVRHLAHFPTLWVALGESYWDLSNFYNAVTSFEKAASLDCNDVFALIRLSCSMRLLLGKENDTTEKCKILIKMVQLARQAVFKCPELGETWYNLGNALLVYFNVKSKPELILESLEVFKKANKAEFHYNYGMAHLLYGNYLDALAMWNRATALEPDWNEPTEKIDHLVKHLSAVNDLVTGKDRTFRRRVKQLAESVPTKNLATLLEDISAPEKASYTVVSIGKLVDGRNEGVVTHGKIYSIPYQTPDASRLIFVVDSTGEYVPVIIYNMGVEFSFGGSVSIPDPVICNVNLTHLEKAIRFRYIRVDEPWKMFHNFIQVPKRHCAQTVITTSPVLRDG